MRSRKPDNANQTFSIYNVKLTGDPEKDELILEK
jgi:hypothetical protein